MLRQEAQSHPGRYSNEGKRKQQKNTGKERKTSQQRRDGRRALAQDRRQEGLSTFRQEQSSLENQLQEDNLSA